MKGFFYIQSFYSLLKSLNSLEDIITISKDNKYDFVTLSDDENLHGMVHFLSLCKQYQIKPICGIKINLYFVSCSDKINIIEILVYALNDQGLRNLIKLSNMIKLQKKHIYLKDLVNFHDDMFFILPILDDYFYEKVKNSYFKQDIKTVEILLLLLKNKLVNFYIGLSLQTPYLKHIADYIVDLSNKLDIKILPTHKTNYLDSQDHDSYKVMNLLYQESIKSFKQDVKFNCNDFTAEEIRFKNDHTLNLDFTTPSKFTIKNDDQINLSFLTKKEFDLQYGKFLSIFINLKQLVNRCHYQGIFFNHFSLPLLGFTEKIHSQKMLEQEVFYNLTQKIQKNKFNNVNLAKYRQRLDYELDIIFSMNYENYFLIVADIIKYARKNFILVGPGRGSSVSSLVCFCLNITEVDPLQYDLFFERFLNPQRTKMPDIDLDFPDDQREIIIDYIKNKYHYNHVANIITFIHFSPKFLLSKVINILEINPIKRCWLVDMIYDKKQNSQISKIMRIVDRIQKIPKDIGTHPSGVIISNQNLTQELPMQLKNNLFQTQFSDEILQKIGVIKIDFLGIKTLSLMRQILEHIPHLNIKNIGLDDRKTYQLLQKAKTLGIFQLESFSAKSVLQKLQPAQFLDLIAVLAFNRPGTISFVKSYLQNKKNSEKKFFHSLIDPILLPTYGIILYQEQIMQIVYIFANYNLIEADNFRIAVTSNNMFFLSQEKKIFIAKSLKNGHNLEIINRVYDYILSFSNYVFNKSHSVSYSLISYRMAFLKANYSSIFYLVFLNNFINDLVFTQNLMIENIAKIQFILPNVKISYDQYYLMNNAIVLPLNLIKGVTNVFYQKLSEERKKSCFHNYEDFKHRLKTVLNDNLLDNLIFAGALDIFGLNRKTLFKNKNLEILEYQQNLKNYQLLQFEEFSDNELKMRTQQAFTIKNLLTSGININFFEG